MIGWANVWAGGNLLETIKGRIWIKKISGWNIQFIQILHNFEEISMKIACWLKNTCKCYCIWLPKISIDSRTGQIVFYVVGTCIEVPVCFLMLQNGTLGNIKRVLWNLGTSYTLHILCNIKHHLPRTTVDLYQLRLIHLSIWEGFDIDIYIWDFIANLY